MPNIGPLEIIIVLVVVLVIFGPKRLPELGKGLGKGMRDFKEAVTGKDDDEPKELESKASSEKATVQISVPVEPAEPVEAATPAERPASEAERETAGSGG
jgi:sec-independent protein translocase protein TatA